MTHSVDKPNTWTVNRTERLIQFVRAEFQLSAGKAKALIERGHFTINTQPVKKPGAEVKIGHTLSYQPHGPESRGPFGVRKVFIDRDLVIVDKPSGLLSAPQEGHKEPSALSAARRFCQKGGRGPKIVHRLDKTTSGLLAFARGLDAARSLNAQLESRKMKRTYLAVVQGVPSARSGIIESRLVASVGRGKRGSLPNTFKVHSANRPPKPVEAGHGKWSATQYTVVWASDGFAGLELQLITGRTHQIRIHLSELGVPICGEPVYGHTRHDGRLALHATSLSLRHPKSGDLRHFKAPWPDSLAQDWAWPPN